MTQRGTGSWSTVACLSFLVFIAYALFQFGVASRRFALSVAREDRLLSLHQQLTDQRDRARVNADQATRLMTVLCNVRDYLGSLNDERQLRNDDRLNAAHSLIQRMVEAVARDVKHEAGESHRCALWVEQEAYLLPLYVSSGFPPHYLKSGRRLSAARSLAAKALRHGKSMKWDDVSEDDEWEPEREGPQRHRALMCVVPKASEALSWVLTVDALYPMADEDLRIAEVYGRVIEGSLVDMMEGVTAAGGDSQRAQAVAAAAVASEVTPCREGGA